MQRQRPASLGAFLFGFPPQDGYSDSDEQAPDAWRILFVTEHADGGVLWGLLCSCQAGRDLILQVAAQATLHFDFAAAEQPAGVWLRRLHTARRALVRRGAKGTRLALTVGTDSLPAFTAAAVLLREPLPAIAELRVRAAREVVDYEAKIPHGRTITGLLQCAAPSLINLRTLSIEDTIVTLPPNTLLPHVIELKLQVPLADLLFGYEAEVQDMCTHLAPYVRQVHSLCLDGVNGPPQTDEDIGAQTLFDWPTIFSPATTSTTLTHFTCDECLTDQLLGLLLAHAPALKRLGVWRVDLESDAHRGKVWGVEYLSLLGWVDDRGGMQHLPSTTAGTLKIEIGLHVWFEVQGPQGLDASMCQRFPEWQMTVKETNFMGTSRLQPAYQLPADEHPAALLAALRQLRGLRFAAGTAVRLHGWRWTAAMAASAAEILSTMPTQQPTWKLFDNNRLTTDSFNFILQLAPHVQSVWAHGLDLQSEQHVNAAWPAATQLKLYSLDIMQLQKLPHKGMQGVRTLRVAQFNMVNYIYQADVKKLQGVLSQMHFAPISDMGLRTVTLKSTRASYQARALKSQLAVLQAMHSAAQPGLNLELRLDGWAMTHKVIDALCQLPAWGPRIALSVCAWPQEASAYQRLASVIPTCYTRWQLPALPQAHVESICAGLNEYRAGKGLPQVHLYVQGYRGEPRPVGEHVVLDKDFHWWE